MCEWINKICNGNFKKMLIFVTKIFKQQQNENNQSTRKMIECVYEWCFKCVHNTTENISKKNKK